jgi:hypothetical protein
MDFKNISNCIRNLNGLIGTRTSLDPPLFWPLNLASLKTSAPKPLGVVKTVLGPELGLRQGEPYLLSTFVFDHT